VDIKTSSHKKLIKFIKAVSKLGLVATKPKGGALMITSVNR